eukprot:gene7281-8092_t
MKKRAIITGASGLLGRAIIKHFQANGDWEVLGLAYSRAENNSNLKKVDLRNEQEVMSTIKSFEPSFIVHAAAERRPDFVEKQEGETAKLNVDATCYLAKAAADAKAYMLYISTDYVFDGTNPPYKPYDKPNPLNKYGQSKLDGENVTIKHCPTSGVLRVPVLYGPVEHLHESVITGLYDLIKSENSCKVSNFEQRYPTSVDDIAVVCLQMAEKHIEGVDLNGIWHWRSNDKLTKYEMIKKIGQIFGVSIEHIQAENEPSPGAKRPYDCEFDCSDLEKLGIGQRTSFENGVKPCLDPFL